MVEIIIHPRDVYEHYIYVQEQNTTIKWKFSTKDKNIDFGLFYRPGPQMPSQPLASSSLDRRRKQSSAYLQPNPAHLQPAGRRKSTASISLQRKDFIELLAVEHTRSATELIVGTHTAEKEGNYVLLFDNKLSTTTSKLLTLSIDSDKPIRDDTEPADSTPIQSGWLLKKRRKRMQGWAKRWFELLPTGNLYYMQEEHDSIKRGSIQVVSSTVCIYPKPMKIHIDSGNIIYHLKVENPEDYERWVEALRRCLASRNNAAQSSGILVDGSWLLADSKEGLNSSQIHGEGPRGHHATIIHGLSSLSNDISVLQELIEEMCPPISRSGSRTSNTKMADSTPPTSPAVPKKRFTLKRGTSNSSSVTNLETTSGIESPDVVDRLNRLLRNLTESRDNISAAYEKQCTYWEMHHSDMVSSNPKLDMVGGTEDTPGLDAHKSPSFYSYRTSAQSETFFDANEQFVLSGDDEDIEGDDHVDDSETDEDDADTDVSDPPTLQVQRRTKLPHPVAGHEVSMVSIFKKNIGKDLSKISMPVSLNEPMNLLQRMCEELEYSELLDKANEMESSIDRLMYVTTFAISGYASTQYRVSRKLWNPLMSETFECKRPDKGFQFLAEKVSHNPNVMACHADSKNFTFWQSSQVSSKFWGRSMELISEGLTHVVLADHNDDFTYNKPTSFVRSKGLSGLSGEKYLVHVGEMKIENRATGEYCVASFKEADGGYFKSPSKPNCVEARCFDKSGTEVGRLVGRWNESFSKVIDKNSFTLLWNAKPIPKENQENYYGFSQFAIELNETTELESGKLPKTDTRNRPDQQLFEEGKVDDADASKCALEARQRERRKVFEDNGEQWEPLWFQKQSDDSGETPSWEYKGGYWEARNNGNWPEKLLDIFNTAA